LLGTLSFALLHGAVAQEEDSLLNWVTLNPAPVIGVDFVQSNQLNSPKSVVSLQAEEWMTSASITEALEFIPGVDIQSRGAWGVQTDVSIRGGTFEQVALLVDGMRWSAPHTGHHLMNIPIDPEDLGRVEVIKSGGGPWAGVGAFSGAINLQTQQATNHNRVTVSAELGSFDWQRFRASTEWNTGAFSHRFSASQFTTSGHVMNADVDVKRFFYRTQLAHNAHAFTGLLAGETKSFGAQNFYTAVYPNQFEETGAAVGQLGWRFQKEELELSAGIHTRFHQDRFELFREGVGWYQLTDDGFYVAQLAAPDTAGLYATSSSWYAGANQHRSFVGATNFQVNWTKPRWVFSAAADARTERIRSNRLGEPVEGEESIYNFGDVRQNLDGYASAHFRGNQITATATVGVNANSRFGTNVLPSAQFSTDLGENGRLFGSAGRSVRHPSFTDLYYNLGGAVGSENLLPEQSDQAEFGARWKMASGNQGNLYIESTRFYRRGTGLIDWVRYDGSSVYEAKNLSEIDFWGGDITMEYRQKKGAQPHIQQARVSSTWMDANRVSTGFTSNYVLDFVRVKYDALIHLAGLGPMEWILRSSIQDRNGGSMIEDDRQLLHLYGMEWIFRGNDEAKLAWKGNLRLDNLLNVQYADRGQVVQPGRMVRFGLTFEWTE